VALLLPIVTLPPASPCQKYHGRRQSHAALKPPQKSTPGRLARRCLVTLPHSRLGLSTGRRGVGGWGAARSRLIELRYAAYPRGAIRPCRAVMRTLAAGPLPSLSLGRGGPHMSVDMAARCDQHQEREQEEASKHCRGPLTGPAPLVTLIPGRAGTQWQRVQCAVHVARSAGLTSAEEWTNCFVLRNGRRQSDCARLLCG
jgi:hypothetical protein